MRAHGSGGVQLRGCGREGVWAHGSEGVRQPRGVRVRRVGCGRMAPEA